MFKDQYHKIYQDAAPSPALEQETLARMAEAQEHLYLEKETQTAPKRKLILPLSLSAAAAVLALTVGLSFWLNRPEYIEDSMGDMDTIISGSPSLKPEKDPDADDFLGGFAPDEEQKGDSAAKPDENKGTQKPSTTPDDENENKAPADESEEPSTEDDLLKGDDSAEQEPEQQAPADPTLPVEINNATTATYASLQFFLDDLSQGTALGYKKNYYADSSLIIVPSFLPQTSRFRQLYLSNSGKYSYSYCFTAENQQYFLDIEVGATLPRTLRDLNLRKTSAKTEKVGFDKKGNQRIYYFGNFDKCTVTLRPVDSKAALPTVEQTDTLLGDFTLARCTAENPLLSLTY